MLQQLSVSELAKDAYKGQLDALRARIAAQAGGNKQIIRAAWLLKRKDKGRGKVSGWKKRFVVLDVDTISYFKEPGQDRLGSFELLLTEAKAPENEKSSKNHIQLVTVEGVYGLACAEDGGNINEWLVAIVEQRRALFEGTGAGANAKGVSKMGGSHTVGKAGSTSTLGANYMSQVLGGASSVSANAQPSSNGGVGEPGEQVDPKRSAAIAELIATEEVYVNNLGVIIRHWKEGLAQLVEPTVVQQVFSNVMLLEPVNAQLLARLRKPEARGAVGAAFLQMLPFFKMYKDYCSNQEQAMATLENLKKTKKAVREFLEKQRDHPACSSMNIESFLIMPMQRICRYPLILGEILKHTAETSDDYAQLQAALEAVSAVGKEVNEQKKLAEEREKILEIQELLMRDNKDMEPLLAPSRRYAGQQTILRALAFGDEIIEPHIYLFNDLLLLCEKKRDKTLLKYSVPLGPQTECGMIEEVTHNGFVVSNGETRIELRFASHMTAADMFAKLSSGVKLLQDNALRREEAALEDSPTPRRFMAQRSPSTVKSPRSMSVSGFDRTYRPTTPTGGDDPPIAASPPRRIASGSGWTRAGSGSGLFRHSNPSLPQVETRKETVKAGSAETDLPLRLLGRSNTSNRLFFRRSSKADLPAAAAEEANQSPKPLPRSSASAPVPSRPGSNSPVLLHVAGVDSSEEQDDGSDDATPPKPVLLATSPNSSTSSPRPRGVAALAATQFHGDTSSDSDSMRSPPRKPPAGDASSEEDIVHWG